MVDYKVIKLETAPDVDHLPYWDVVIIGAGPAGLAAGLTTAHRGLTTLVIEAKDQPGGQPQFLYPDKQIVDIPGFPDGITGEELSTTDVPPGRRRPRSVPFRGGARRDRRHDAGRGGPPQKGRHQQEQLPLPQGDPGVRLASLPAEASHTRPPRSPRVHYRIPRDDDYRGSRVLVVGGGDSALDAALMVLGRGGRVDLVVRGRLPREGPTRWRGCVAGGRHCAHLHGSHRRGTDGRADPRVAQQRQASFPSPS